LNSNIEHDSTPSTFEATELSASLTVADIHRSLEWYRQVIGFAITRRFERDGSLRAVSLRAGSVRVLLTQDDGARGADRAKGEGISLMLTTSQDIDAIASRVRDAGWELETEPTDMPHGPRMFRVRDPDGFKFTVSSG
jgi:uncharacterized glyoxalase superfamily protein PhnB